MGTPFLGKIIGVQAFNPLGIGILINLHAGISSVRGMSYTLWQHSHNSFIRRLMLVGLGVNVELIKYLLRGIYCKSPQRSGLNGHSKKCISHCRRIDFLMLHAGQCGIPPSAAQ